MTRPLDSNITRNTIKFLYSYGGKVLPRPTDGQLRYVGGYTRVLAVDRSITYAELMVKFGELCGSSMKLKCKLPNEDLDLLVTITCDEDLDSAIEEYDRVSISSNKDMKIRAILFPHKSLKKISPPSSSPSTASSLDYSPSKPPLYPRRTAVPAYQSASRCYSNIPVYQCHSPAVGFPLGVQKAAAKVQPRQWYSVRRWNQWL